MSMTKGGVVKEISPDDEDRTDDSSRKSIPLYQLLPAPVRKRVKALKKLQLETMKLEAKFFIDVHKLECRYQNLYSQLFTKREQILIGLVEPRDEDCLNEEPSSYNEEPDEDDKLIKDLSSKLTITKLIEEGASGIPEFWLTVFKNVQLFNEVIQPHDEPILRHLLDIKVLLLENDPMGFVLEFHFSPNPYFSNSVLTKEYVMKCSPDDGDPWSFEGPEIIRAKGCNIDWKKGMNVTLKTVQKRQKHKSRGNVRTIVKTVQNESFFNFFNPPIIPEDQEGDIDEDTQTILTTDFEIGHFIREKIVPRAVLYYTGEAFENETDESEEESSESEYEENEDEDEDEEEEQTTEENESDANEGGEPRI